jgi:hypothetical protein
MAANSIIVGPVAPENLQVTITRGTEAVDLSTVTAVSLEVIRKGSADRQTWATTIKSKVADTIVVNHVFQQGDLARTGTYTVLGFLTIPSGVVRATCGTLAVIEP